MAVTDPRAPSYRATGAALARMLAAGPHSARRKAAAALSRPRADYEPDDLDLPPSDRQAAAEYHAEEEANDGWLIGDEDFAGDGFEEQW